MSKKVLIVYATGGMGHVSAAKAIEQAFKEKYSDVEIKNVDVIDFAMKVYKKVFVDGYNYVSAKTPELWGWLYRTYNDQSKQKLPRMLSQLAIEGKFIPFIEEFQPDFIISTHPLPMLLVSHSKKKHIINILSSMVLTDFGCHSFWIAPEVNYYFVSTENVKKCLLDYQVKSEQIGVTGIPIENKFFKVKPRAELIQKLGLEPDLFTILIVGGQFSYQALETIIGGITKKHDGQVQFLVVAGRDKELKEALDKSDLNKDSKIKTFGFIDNMHELMAVSDLIFSKAGGLTVSECMAMGLPMVINKVIPGQEQDNVNYLVQAGAAVKVEDFDQVVNAVNDLVSDPQKVAEMKAACQKIGKPKSAEALADFVYGKINK
ncbi:MAG: glycosyltransferase [Candidatus Buchananbacteria bacterium]